MRSFGELVQSLEFVLHARKRLEYLRGAWRAFFADRGKEEGESRMWIRDDSGCACLGGATPRKHTVVEPTTTQQASKLIEDAVLICRGESECNFAC